MTIQVNMHEAKSQFSKLAEPAVQGETVVIAKAGKPLVDLVPHRGGAAKMVPGRYAGQIKMADDFIQTPSDVINSFEDD